MVHFAECVSYSCAWVSMYSSFCSMRVVLTCVGEHVSMPVYVCRGSLEALKQRGQGSCNNSTHVLVEVHIWERKYESM